jgi:hypothetical protein
MGRIVTMDEEFAWYENVVVFFAIVFGFLAFGIYIGGA